jgi:predicted transcriptional regulator
MAKENLSVSLPSKIRSMVEKEAKRRKRSRSAVVRDALHVYFRLKQVGDEEPTAADRAAIAAGRRAYQRGQFQQLDEWRHAVGLGDH